MSKGSHIYHPPPSRRWHVPGKCRHQGSARFSWAGGQRSKSAPDCGSFWDSRSWDDGSWHDRSEPLWHEKGDSYYRYDRSYDQSRHKSNSKSHDDSYHYDDPDSRTAWDSWSWDHGSSHDRLQPSLYAKGDRYYGCDKSYHWSRDKCHSKSYANSHHDVSYHDNSYHHKSNDYEFDEKDKEKCRGKSCKHSEYGEHPQPWQSETLPKLVKTVELDSNMSLPPPPPPALTRSDRFDHDKKVRESKSIRRSVQNGRKANLKSEDGGVDDHHDELNEHSSPDSLASSQVLIPLSFQVAGEELSGSECLQRLGEFVATFPLDSFAVGSFCHEPEKSALFEEGKDSKGKAIMTLRLPAACCPHLLVLEEQIESPLEARMQEFVMQKLAAGALSKLNEKGLWPAPKPEQIAFEPVVAIPVFETQNGTSGTELRSNQQIDQWPETVHFYAVDADDGHMWGLATTSPVNFSYQLQVDDSDLRLEAMTVTWNAAHAARVLEFQKHFISRGPEEPLEMLVVKVLRIDENVAKMDFDAMQGSPSHVPWWFPHLIRKMERISLWERVRRQAPSEPLPSPLRLHVIFDEPIAITDAQDYIEARQCLAEIGADGLRLAAVVAKSHDDPLASRSQLEKRVEEFVQPVLLAELMVNTGLLHFGSRQNISKEDAAEMLLALLGTHKLEGDMFSVVRLWQWVSRGRTGRTGSDALLTALDHTAGCPRYLGRTPSYLEFGEMMLPADERDGGPQLLVRFEEYDDAIYRWFGSKAQEKRPDLPGACWQTVLWDPMLGTFSSPSMLLADGRPRPLPNKVCAWLRGRSITKLVSIKHSMEVTPPYTSLREDNGRLAIAYKDHGEIFYRRCPDGGLGIEIQQSGDKEVEKNLSYSESKKTLMSQFITGYALPRKAVTWLSEPRCLADLIPGRRKASVDVDTTKDGIASWKFEGREYSVQVRRNGKPQYGVIYESVNGEALSYSEQEKAWIVRPATTADSEAIVPFAAIAHIAADTKAEPSMKLLFPQLSGTDLAEIEQHTDHRFKSTKLLAEALTHCSATTAMTPSCEHLALVGEIALKACASEKLCRSELNCHVSFFIAPLVVKEGVPHARSFFAPAGWNAWASTKRSQAERISTVPKNCIESFRAMRHWLQACCNHVSYAHSCVRLSLHNAINESSPELKRVVKSFERRMLRKQSVKEKWTKLFKSGAPKVLGDVYLACVGAIVMDSDHTQAENLFSKHCKECRDVFDLLPLDMPMYEMVSLDDMRVTFDIFVQAASRSSASKQLACWVPSTKEPGDESGARRSFRLAHETKCTDLCLLEVDHEGGYLFCSSSPRAAVIGYSLKQLQDKEDVSSEGSEPDFDAFAEAGRPEAEDENKAQPEHEGAIYCRYCEMWLNGPTQWADHEIGKKHRKAVRRKQASLQGVSVAVEIMDQMLPSVPDGFGKKKPAADRDHLNEDTEENAQNLDEEELAGDAEESFEAVSQSQEYSNTWTSHGGQEVFGYYVNPHTGEWVQGTVLMPAPFWGGSSGSRDYPYDQVQ